MTNDTTFDADGNDTTQSNTGSAAKDPKDWTTGNEDATAAQKSYLETLATEAGQDIDPNGLTKADASRKIEELQDATDRGQGTS